jgi:pyruvate/2-oxoglutarate dehydrogenase complex dihydrolipoamide dehydrogenase (E3) component
VTHFDVLVLGAGSGGYVAAIRALIRPVVLMVIRLSAYRHIGTGHLHCADRR